MRNNLNIAVLPKPFEEEFADAHWYPWMVIGHEDPEKMTEDVVKLLIKDFFDHARSTWPYFPYFDDNYGECGEFLDFCDTRGYTTFNETQLIQCIT